MLLSSLTTCRKYLKALVRGGIAAAEAVSPLTSPPEGAPVGDEASTPDGNGVHEGLGFHIIIQRSKEGRFPLCAVVLCTLTVAPPLTWQDGYGFEYRLKNGQGFRGPEVMPGGQATGREDLGRRPDRRQAGIQETAGCEPCKGG